MARTDEIRARLAAATGGDWLADGASVYGPLDTRSRYKNSRQLIATITDRPFTPGVAPGPRHADATLIGHAGGDGGDLAYLLDEVAQLRAELAALELLRLAAADLRDAQAWIERAAAGEAEEDAACGAFDDAAAAICDAVDALRAVQ